MITLIYFFFLTLTEILFNLYELYSQGPYYDLIYNVIPSGNVNDNVNRDPPRWWPSGVPQGMAVIGTALATFTILGTMRGVTPKGRVLGALASAGVTTANITYHSSIEIFFRF